MQLADRLKEAGPEGPAQRKQPEVQLLREVELLPPRSLHATWPTVHFGDVVTLNTDRSANPAAAGIERFVGLEHIDLKKLVGRSSTSPKKLNFLVLTSTPPPHAS